MPKTNCELEEQAAHGVISTQVLFYTVSLISAEEKEQNMRVGYDIDVDSLATLPGHK